MSQITTSKFDLTIKPDKFSDFHQKMDDLSKIGDVLKIKMDGEETLIYSMVGENMILAFKSYVLKTIEYFELKDNLSGVLDIIISGSRKFVKNLSMIKKDNPIKIEVSWRENDEGSMCARFIQIKNGKFKLGQSCGEESEIRNISKEALDQKLNLKSQKWSFIIKKSDFDDVKKLSNINSDGKILNLNVDGDGKVIISESNVWELEVDDIESTNKTILFSKSYLGNIDDDMDEIKFHVFESFILNKNPNSNLMISFETQFED